MESATAQQSQPTPAPPAQEFKERRNSNAGAPGVERRQFSDSRDASRPEVRELAEAVDAYKLRHRRRFITFDELFDLIEELGYARS